MRVAREYGEWVVFSNMQLKDYVDAVLQARGQMFARGARPDFSSKDKIIRYIVNDLGIRVPPEGMKASNRVLSTLNRDGVRAYDAQSIKLFLKSINVSTTNFNRDSAVEAIIARGYEQQAIDWLEREIRAGNAKVRRLLSSADYERRLSMARENSRLQRGPEPVVGATVDLDEFTTMTIPKLKAWLKAKEHSKFSNLNRSALLELCRGIKAGRIAVVKRSQSAFGGDPVAAARRQETTAAFYSGIVHGKEATKAAAQYVAPALVGAVADTVQQQALLNLAARQRARQGL
jgi:hypothetical protein